MSKELEIKTLQTPRIFCVRHKASGLFVGKVHFVYWWTGYSHALGIDGPSFTRTNFYFEPQYWTTYPSLGWFGHKILIADGQYEKDHNNFEKDYEILQLIGLGPDGIGQYRSRGGWSYAPRKYN